MQAMFPGFIRWGGTEMSHCSSILGLVKLSFSSESSLKMSTQPHNITACTLFLSMMWFLSEALHACTWIFVMHASIIIIVLILDKRLRGEYSCFLVFLGWEMKLGSMEIMMVRISSRVQLWPVCMRFRQQRYLCPILVWSLLLYYYYHCHLQPTPFIY